MTNKNEMVIKTTHFEQKVNDADRTVTGVAAVFGNIDTVGDMLHPGAFTKTIQERLPRIKHLWQHDTEAPPVAVIKELREIGREELPPDVKERFPEASGGLLVARRYLETPRGSEVWEGLREGAITEMSFGFNVVKADFSQIERDGDALSVRNIREARLWDISDVNWGANPATVAVKSAFDAKLTAAQQYIDALLAELNDLPPNDVYAHLDKASQVDTGQFARKLNQLEELMQAEPPAEALTRDELIAQLDLLEI